MNEVRTAILKAADHIENNPHEFLYKEVCVPDCGTPGCAAGWIAHFMGVKFGTPCWGTFLMPILGINSNVFIDRMDAIQFYHWRVDAQVCAATLRHYADKHHPAEAEYSEVSKELDRIFKEVPCEQRSTQTKVS